MGNKYFTFSIDDGLEQDKEIIKILKKYGMGATFNINSGLFGQRAEIERIGNMGIKAIETEKYQRRLHLLPSSHQYRIPEDEVKQVYEGFEVAAHSLSHPKMAFIKEQETEKEISEDVHNLTALFERKITGFAYPHGMSNKYTDEILKKNGIMYARTIDKAKNFSFPQDPMHLPITCWHFQENAFDLIDEFGRLESDEDMLFVMFAHGYEFDFGTKNSNWEKFKKLCDRAAQYSNVNFCTTGEAFMAHVE